MMQQGGGPFGRSQQQALVNIENTEASFIITLYAAGLAKDKLQLTVQDDVLTIAYQGAEPATADSPAEAAATAGERRFTRREYTNGSFERSFQLNNKVLVANITSGYADGILTVTLPKNPATNQPSQSISVS